LNNATPLNNAIALRSPMGYCNDKEWDIGTAMSENLQAVLSERAAERRLRMTAHIAANWSAADDWDLEFWQRQGPEARLSALVALRNDVTAIRGKDSAMERED